MDQYLEKYLDISKEMVGIYIYVEGNNSIFYKHLREFEATALYSKDVIGGNSSSTIRKIVAEDRAKGLKAFGIVDKDYNSYFDEYVYPIDYYCIENIVLLKIGEFSSLKLDIENLINNDLDIFKLLKFDLEIKRGDDNRVLNYSIQTSKTIHCSYHPYLHSIIRCNDTFLKYKDFKSVVEKFLRFRKEKYGKSSKAKYLEDLVDCIEDKSLASIVSTQTYSRFMSDISAT